MKTKGPFTQHAARLHRHLLQHIFHTDIKVQATERGVALTSDDSRRAEFRQICQHFSKAHHKTLLRSEKLTEVLLSLRFLSLFTIIPSVLSCSPSAVSFVEVFDTRSEGSVMEML